jgi:hypothetical protein
LIIRIYIQNYNEYLEVLTKVAVEVFKVLQEDLAINTIGIEIKEGLLATIKEKLGFGNNKDFIEFSRKRAK